MHINHDLEDRAHAVIAEGIKLVDDCTALTCVELYPEWERLVELGKVKAEANTFRFRHKGRLYRCIKKDPAFQADWVPGVGTESMYTRIDETHAGTLEDPIPYAGNMELSEGLYYAQGGVVYRCTRSTGNPVHDALSALVGFFVEVAV